MTRVRRFDTLLENFLRVQHEAGDVPCTDYPTYFFPEDFPDADARRVAIKIAKKLCGDCPIRDACRTYAIESNQRYGIWAGTLPSER